MSAQFGFPRRCSAFSHSDWCILHGQICRTGFRRSAHWIAIRWSRAPGQSGPHPGWKLPHSSPEVNQPRAGTQYNRGSRQATAVKAGQGRRGKPSSVQFTTCYDASRPCVGMLSTFFCANVPEIPTVREKCMFEQRDYYYWIASRYMCSITSCDLSEPTADSGTPWHSGRRSVVFL